MKLRELGKTGILLSPIGLGCWQFSAALGITGGVWQRPEDQVMRDIVQTALDGGINWFDTAQIYGNGTSEQALSLALRAVGIQPGRTFIATKWWPVLKTAADLERTFPDRQAGLAPYPVDLLQIHQPFSISSAEKQAMALARLLIANKVKAVGVSNFSAAKMRRVHKVLSGEGLFLASNQVRFSLNHRKIETDGTLHTARELGVSIIAWSPLSQGLLTGRFHTDASTVQQTSSMRRMMGGLGKANIEKTRPLIDVLSAIAKVHSVSIAQVALAATINLHGDLVFAIPGATKVVQAQDAAASAKLVLSTEELQRINDASLLFR